MNARMNRNRLNIGAYILRPYARTEKHIRQIKECGLDFIVCMDNDRKALDLFSKYGLGACVVGVVPGWWGGNGDNAGTMEATNPFPKYIDAAKNFEDHPAVWGIDIGDEPSALDFEYYEKIQNFVQTGFPMQFPYLNLYPNYASICENNDEQTVNQLGTPTYAEHIEQYCQKISLDYIMFDYYVYSTNSVMGCMENFRVVADAARRYGRSFWFIPQVNSFNKDEWTSENMLRFQAFASMCFGAESIIWACYTAGWWHNQVLDSDGNKTEQYDKLKKINKEIANLGVPYMNYRCTYTHFIGFDNNNLDILEQKSVDELNNGCFRGLRSDDGRQLVVGDFTGKTDNNKKAVFVLAADDYRDEHNTSTTLKFRCEGRTVLANGGNGKLPVKYNKKTHEYSVDIKSNQGIFIEAI